MARRCDISGKRANVANNVSHSLRRTKKKQQPNLQKKKIFVPELNRYVTLKVCTKVIKTITKKGLLKTLKDYNLTINDVTKKRR